MYFESPGIFNIKLDKNIFWKSMGRHANAMATWVTLCLKWAADVSREEARRDKLRIIIMLSPLIFAVFPSPAKLQAEKFNGDNDRGSLTHFLFQMTHLIRFSFVQGTRRLRFTISLWFIFISFRYRFSIDLHSNYIVFSTKWIEFWSSDLYTVFKTGLMKRETCERTNKSIFNRRKLMPVYIFVMMKKFNCFQIENVFQ